MSGMEPISDDMPTGAPSQAEARKHIRRFTTGVLRAGDRIHSTAFVIDGRDGSVVFPCGDEDADGCLLSIPDDGFDEMSLLLDAEPFTVRFDEVKDRHQAYHGIADGRWWFRCRVDSAKWKGAVFDGASVLNANMLRSDEPLLCRTLNADNARLAELTRLLTGVKPEQSVCVGVDPIGMDVRTRVGVIRVEWPREIEGPDQAHAVVGALLADGLPGGA